MTPLASLLAGPLTTFSRCWATAVTDSSAEAPMLRELFEPRKVNEVLEHHAAGFPGGKRRAINLHWATWYFARVLPIEVGAALCGE